MLLTRKVSLFALLLVGLLAVAVAPQADAQMCGQQKVCTEGKNVSALQPNVETLLASWETARAETAALSEADREQFASQCANVAKDCPIGSRVGFTMKTVRGVLGAAIAAEENCAKNCQSSCTPKTEANVAATPAAAPAATGSCEGKMAAGGCEGKVAATGGCDEIKGLMAARSKTLRDLHKLASFAAEFTAPSSCKSSCAEAGAKKDCASMCSIKTAIRVGELKAKWAAAEQEVAALSSEKKQALFTSFSSISEKSKVVALVPPSVLALAQGFEMLDHIDTKIAEWGNNNPEIVKSIPAESRISFEQQNAVIAETAKVLKSIQGVMTKMCDESPAEQPAGPATVQN